MFVLCTANANLAANLREICVILWVKCLQDGSIMFERCFPDSLQLSKSTLVIWIFLSIVFLLCHLLGIYYVLINGRTANLFFTLFAPLFQVWLDVSRSGKDSHPLLAWVLCSFKPYVVLVALDPRSMLICATELKWYLDKCILALFHPCFKPPSEPSPLQMELNGPTNPLEQPPGNKSNFIHSPKCSWKWSKDFIKIWVNCDLGRFLTQTHVYVALMFLSGPAFLCGARCQLRAHCVGRRLGSVVRSRTVITKRQSWISPSSYSPF